MYYPKKFNLKRSVELGKLVKEAYKQHESFETKKEWELPSQYRLISSIKYSEAGKNIFGIDRKLIGHFINYNLIKGRLPVGSPAGFIAEKRNNIYIIFRGTQTPKEWINNLNIKLVPFHIDNCGLVHEGFQNIYLNFRGKIMETVRDFKKRKKIYVAGHSLGAAFAVFAAFDIEKSLNGKIKALYTFASPRIGDNMFVSSFNRILSEKSYRIFNTSDFMTELPFPVVFAGFFGAYFSHVDTPVAFTVQNNDIEKNHHISTYIDYLAGSGKKFFKPAGTY